MGNVKFTQRVSQLQSFLKGKKYLIKQKTIPSVLDIPSPVRPKELKLIYIPADRERNKSVFIELKCNNGISAVIYGEETIELVPTGSNEEYDGVIKTYTYGFSCHAFKYKFIEKENEIEIPGIFNIRFEKDGKGVTEVHPDPHLHALHRFPRYKFDNFTFERFFIWVENYFFKNGVFIDDYPWKRR